MTATYVHEAKFDGADPALVEQLQQVNHKEIAEIGNNMIKNFWAGRPLRDAMQGSKYSEDVILFSLAFFYTE